MIQDNPLWTPLDYYLRKIIEARFRKFGIRKLTIHWQASELFMAVDTYLHWFWENATKEHRLLMLKRIDYAIRHRNPKKLNKLLDKEYN